LDHSKTWIYKEHDCHCVLNMTYINNRIHYMTNRYIGLQKLVYWNLQGANSTAATSILSAITTHPWWWSVETALLVDAAMWAWFKNGTLNILTADTWKQTDIKNGLFFRQLSSEKLK
jgi:hypothetical protein